MRLTIDTNCINTKGRIEAMNTLERWETEGKVKLFRTQRSLLEAGNSSARREKVLNRANVGEPAIADISFLDSDAYLDGPGPEFDSVFKLLFRGIDPGEQKPENNHMTDVMHLLSHASSGNDVFVTNDNDFLREADKLKRQWGIVVMKPDAVVAECQRIHGWI